MQWYNEPLRWGKQGDVITVTGTPKTDFWRKTRSGMIRDDANFYYQEVSGDFVVDVKVTGSYEASFDQAGLMVRLDETVWLKCGIEYVHGMQYASAVITRDFSDWSLVPLPQNPPSTWIRVVRRDATVEIHYSLDGREFTMLTRAYLTPRETLKVGLMIACPGGEGFTARFEEMRIRQESVPLTFHGG